MDGQTTVALGLLGPFVLSVHGVDQPLGGPRQRAVLALLALEPNRTVSVERIIVDLWDDDRLKQPRNNVQVYVSNLRRILRGCEAEISIVGDGTGYQLRVADGVVDLQQFDDLVAEGGRQLDRGLGDAAASTTAAALALWRGPFLDDLAVQFDVFTAAAMRVDERRLAAHEQWIAAELAAGRATTLISELERLVSTYPLHEGFWGQLMTALAQAGRQRDALHAYQRARTTLGDEAGLEPGRELRALESALLAGSLPGTARGNGTMLLFADAAGRPRHIALTPESTYTIGRHQSADITIEWDARASRVHAELHHDGSGWVLTDRRSTNGTYVGGQQVTSGTALLPGDVFVVGSTAFTLRSGADGTAVVLPSEVTMMERRGAVGT
jgi:SARP family transcriptional regulator, regulator of embCAB operon